MNNNNNNNNRISQYVITKKGTHMSIDFAIPGDRNVIKKEAEKILKYKDLITQNWRMWNVNAKLIPVLTGARGTILKSLRQYSSNITGNNEIKEMQKAAILGTAHILRKMLI